jgi:hypothetical protein
MMFYFILRGLQAGNEDKLFEKYKKSFLPSAVELFSLVPGQGLHRINFLVKGCQPFKGWQPYCPYEIFFILHTCPSPKSI